MWLRTELKEKGKAAFKKNYWNCVIVGLVSLAVTGGSLGAGSGSGSGTSTWEALQSLRAGLTESGFSFAMLIGVIAALVGIAFLFGLALYALVKLPFVFGVKKFFLKNAEGHADLKEILSGFQKERYWRIIGTQLLETLFVSIGLMLFVIPGIVLMYRYRMVRFILAEEGIGGMDCLRRSKEMMDGEKWNAWVLDLSFLGWEILSLCTCGILGIFYVNPYKEATDAELYRVLKNKNC